MTEQEIQDRNKQIIQMLGFKRGFWIHQEKPLTDDKKQWWDIDGKTFLGTRVHYDKDLQFHSDWNWLMEAIQFLQKHFESKEMVWTSIQRYFLFTDIETVFTMVSDYAKHYNEGKL
jgi:hypothetical protein